MKAQFFPVKQGEERTIGGGQFGHRDINHGIGQLLGLDFGASRRFQIHVMRLILYASCLLNTAVYGDPKQPRAEARSSVKSDKVAVDECENLLDRVGGLVSIQQDAPRDREHLFVIFAVQELERARLTR